MFDIKSFDPLTSCAGGFFKNRSRLRQGFCNALYFHLLAASNSNSQRGTMPLLKNTKVILPARFILITVWTLANSPACARTRQVLVLVALGSVARKIPQRVRSKESVESLQRGHVLIARALNPGLRVLSKSFEPRHGKAVILLGSRLRPLRDQILLGQSCHLCRAG